jgi:hypothetical protein
VILLSQVETLHGKTADTPTYEKLDCFLSTIVWEHKFPLVTVHALTQSVSDHTPLLIDSGVQSHLGNNSRFSFELSWLRHDGFLIRWQPNGAL